MSETFVIEPGKDWYFAGLFNGAVAGGAVKELVGVYGDLADGAGPIQAHVWLLGNAGILQEWDLTQDPNKVYPPTQTQAHAGDLAVHVRNTGQQRLYAWHRRDPA